MPQEDASSSDYRGIHFPLTPRYILSDNDHSISLRFRKQRKLNTLEGERKREIAELHESYKSQMESRDKKIEELYSHINDVKFRGNIFSIDIPSIFCIGIWFGHFPWNRAKHENVDRLQ